jgi:5-methylcytosine-specific restriction endonuclease McrBC GTP-binding regulatory subunit McrB
MHSECGSPGSGHVRFVTFHQSFSYEDFVEGLRADTNKAGQLNYSVQSGVFKSLCVDALESSTEPYVLIIDEINRGNISRIFGELITLIEPSKRAGAPEALSVTLPYSKESFNVPANVYLIGTMNTADRSLAGLDIALRRRFTFKEMPPKPELLDTITITNGSVGQILREMNARIEVLLDRDHCLGHAYFMPLKGNAKFETLKFIFRQQILPLLQEYFFEDWERIAWVLNDQNKPEEQQFIQKSTQPSLTDLFGADIASNLQNTDKRWLINEDAFDDIESYAKIIGANP